MSYDQIIGTQEKATDLQIGYALRDLHTAIPARIIDFDQKTQTATIEILVQKLMADGTGENFPPLLDVPVSFPRGGGFAVTFPLNKGDEGIALFSERCIDGWWENGKPSIPLDFRLHDLSDAIFIPGITSKPKALKGFFNAGMELRTEKGDTFIRLQPGTITIKGDIIHEGNTTQTGTLTVSEDVIGGGVSLKNHVHGGVKTGDGNTEPPVK